MATADSWAGGPAGETWQRVDGLVQRFEEAWQAGQRPALDDYLPKDGPDRLAVLVELAHVDLERRLKAGESARVEEYFGRYPDMAVDRAAALDLIAAEYRLRRPQEPGLTPDGYLARFPQYAADLPARLDNGFGPGTPRLPTSSDTTLWSPDEEALAPRRLGRYEIKGRLGHGGMGIVYRAYDPELGREVAIKVPRFDGPAEGRSRAQARFRREARAAAAVRHPHVCPVYDVGDLEGVPYAVMAYIEGRSLAQLAAEGPAEPRRAAEVVRQVAEGLAAVHGHGIVHRDLKPANILLDKTGQALLTDFGLVRCEDGSSLTADGARAGTPAYMAPEQASLSAGEVGPWTDIYSLAVVLYELLTGQRPFRGDPLTVMYRVAQEVPPPPSRLRPGLDPALEGIVLKAMARRPEERYASAAAFAEALAGWLAGAAGAKPPAPAPKPVRRRPVGLRVVLAAGILLAGAVLAGTVIVIRDKQGKVIQTIPVPPEATVAIEPEQPREAKRPQGADPLGALARKNIPEKERFDWQPAELVAIFGTHAWRSWLGPLQFPLPLDNQPLVLDFTRDGRQVIALDRYGAETPGDAGDTAKSWDAATMKSLQHLTLRQASDMIYLPETRWVGLSAGDSARWTWKLYSLDSGEEKGELVGDGGPDRVLAASADGKLIFDKGRRLWGVPAGRDLARLPAPLPPAPPSPLGDMAGASFSADGKLLAVNYSTPSGPLGTFTLYDTAARKEVASERFPGTFLYGRPVFTPGNKAVLIGKGTRAPGSNAISFSVGLWDLAARQWGTLQVPGRPFGVSPDGRQIAVGAVASTSEIAGSSGVYDTANNRHVTFDGPPITHALVFSPDGKRVAGANFWGDIVVYDAATGKLVTPLPDPFTFLAVSGDGTLMVVPEPRWTGLGARCLRLVETPTGRVRRRVLVPETQGVRSAALSADGKLLAVLNNRFPAGDNWIATRWVLETYDTASGERIQAVESDAPGTPAFAANGRWLVCRIATGDDNRLIVWDTTNWQRKGAIPVPAGGDAAAAVSANGGRVAIVLWGGGDWTLKVFDLAAGTEVFSQVGHGSIYALSSDWGRVAFAGKLFDMTTGKQVASLKGADEGMRPPTDLVFAPDGKSLFGSGPDGRLVRWSAADGSILKEWRLGGYIQRLALTVDGRYLFISNQNGTIYVLRLPGS